MQKHLFTIVRFHIYAALLCPPILYAQHNCLNLDGTNDYVNLDILAPSLAGDNTFTVEFWMKADYTTQTDIRVSLFSVNFPAPYGENRLLILMGGANSQEGKLMIYDENSWGTNSDYTSSSIIGDNTCHHIAYVRNGSLGYIYIDGILVGTHTANYTLTANDRYSIGQEWDESNTSQFYKGNIDEFRVWSVVRSASDIQNHKNQELTGSEADLLVYYPFNQGTPAGNNTSISILQDFSTNQWDGSLQNFALIDSTSNFIRSTCDISAPMSVQGNSIHDYHLLFPNPTCDYINIQLSGNNIHSLTLYDALGNIVLSPHVSYPITRVSLLSLDAAIYFMEITDESGKKVYKILKN